MTSIRFSGVNSASAATSITVAFGGTPSVGDLVLVWLGLSNQIVVQPPGYNGTNQWFKAGGLYGPASNNGLSLYYHTWNQSDVGTVPSFQFSPAPSLGVGDTDLSTASVVLVSATIAASSAVLDYAPQGVPELRKTVTLSPQKRASSSTLVGAYSPSGGAWSATDGTVQATVTLNGRILTVFKQLSATSAGYSPTYTNTVAGDLMNFGVSLSDNGPQVYNPPVIQEGPVANDDPLFVRYKMARYYTVLNNTGVYTAQRYLSTDQIASATAVYTNDAPVTSTARTAILNSGIGGEFRATV